MRIVEGKETSAAVVQWVASRIPFVGQIGFGPAVGIGVVANDGTPLGGVVFHDYQPQFNTMAFSIAADSARWCTKRSIGKIMMYPFDQVGVQKLWTATPSSNTRALRLAAGLGFTREATLARHFGKDHAIINRMFTKDYRRIYGELNIGQASSTRAA